MNPYIFFVRDVSFPLPYSLLAEFWQFFHHTDTCFMHLNYMQETKIPVEIRAEIKSLFADKRDYGMGTIKNMENSSLKA